MVCILIILAGDIEASVELDGEYILMVVVENIEALLEDGEA